ncbi:MAG: protein kinase [Pseudomonadota bacterium]
MRSPIAFGKYHLLERINVGGMAEVFRAKAYGVEGFERLLAVKRILPNIAADKEFINMFIDEAKIAVQLNHANIAQIFDLGRVEGSYFIALEYVHGKDVRAIFEICRNSSKKMPVPQACFVVMKVCEGLDYCHNKRDSAGREMNLVHRDVSPQNILISYDGEVKLVDFGIAKAAGKGSKTQAGILKGKFGYMSPEQVRGLPLDRRSDIFSVGIVLYELITGERLFHGDSDFSTLEKVRNVEILPPSAFNRKIGDELEQIVLKALAKDVDERYQNAIDLHDDLQAYMYTSGEFYSRKDLAAWMKRNFVREIEHEERKLEAERHLPVPELRSASHVPSGSHADFLSPGDELRLPIGGGILDALTPSPIADFVSGPVGQSGSGIALQQRGVSGVGSGQRGMNWDEDEVETHIYDKTQTSSPSLAEEFEVVAASRTKTPVPLLKPLQTGPMQLGYPLEIAHTETVLPVSSALYYSSRRKIWTHVFISFFVLCALAILLGGLYFFLVQKQGPGTIQMTALPSNVEISVSGVRQVASGFPPEIQGIEPGIHVLTIRKSGFETWEQSVVVKANETIQIEPKLEPVANAKIELRSRPSKGEVFLDGRKLEGKTPMRITNVVPGQHRLEIYHSSGYQAWVQQIELHPDELFKIDAELLPRQAEVVEAGELPKPKLGVVAKQPIAAKETKSTTDSVVPKKPKQVSRTTEVPEQPPLLPPKRTKVSVTEREDRTIIPPKPEPEIRKPEGTGNLMVNSNPWATILIDGKETGLTTPQRRILLPAGSHRITLRNEKFGIDQTYTVTILADQVTKLVKKF